MIISGALNLEKEEIQLLLTNYINIIAQQLAIHNYGFMLQQQVYYKFVCLHLQFSLIFLLINLTLIQSTSYCLSMQSIYYQNELSIMQGEALSSQCKKEAMQDQQQQDIRSSSDSDSDSDSINQNFINCPGNKRATLFCLNEKCKQKAAFTCAYFKCKCNTMHKKCKKGIIQAILQTINQKKDQNLGFKQYLSEVINKQIQRLNFFRQKLEKMIDRNKNLLSITPIEIKFQKIFIDKQNPNQFTGEDLSNLWDIANDQKTNEFYAFDQVKKSLETFSKSVIKSLNILDENISKFVEDKQQVACEKPNKVMRKKQINELRIQKFSTMKLTGQSSIIKSVENQQRLINFFSKKVKELSVIFKGNRNPSSLEKYYETCKSQSNTIIICMNNEDKIIGGFTPLSLGCQQIDNKTVLVADSSKSSFVFSLTSNEKFILKNFKQAVRKEDHCSINFGWGFFTIYKCQSNTLCASLNFSVSTYDRLHYRSSQKSYLQINGNKKSYFPIKEWEVIKVQFQK